jgi:hypothetical protein
MDNILITIQENAITIFDNSKKLLINKDNKLFNDLINKIKDKSKKEAKEIIKAWYQKDRFNNLSN